MRYDVNFGTLSKSAAAPRAGKRFRLAVLADLSGRANKGLLDTGAALARRKPLKADVDDLDELVARAKLRLDLPLGEDGETVSVPIAAMDDFHPDQLVENVELFETLLDLRRNLGSKAGFARAAKEVMGWSGAESLPRPAAAGRGTAVDPGMKLSDFARLTGRAPKQAESAEVDDLVRRLVGPFVQASRDPAADTLVEQVDAALSAAMRRVLHHPDFQAAEATWRSLDLLVRQLETGAALEIVLYDVSAEEWAADLAGADDLKESGLYGMLVEEPALDADAGPISAVVGLYGLELSPPHAELLGRMALIAASGGFPFLASLAPDGLGVPMHEQNRLIRDAWEALQAHPASRYLGLATPRVLLRMPYGRKSDPIDAFKFEEFTREAGLSGMLWGEGALVAGLLLAKGWSKAGPKMQPGTVSALGDMPYYVYTAPDGDQVALPCTERLWGEKQMARATPYGVIPIVSLRGRPEVRVAGWSSVAGAPIAGFWDPVAVDTAAPKAPEPAAPAPAPEPVPIVAATVESPAAAEAEPDLDALLASLGTEAAVPEPEAAAADEEEVDLDALLASLSAEPEPAEDGETEVDLDALLASL